MTPKRVTWVVVAALVVAADVYLLCYRLPDVQGNLEASLIWGTPALIAQHLALRRHINRRHEETRRHLSDHH